MPTLRGLEAGVHTVPIRPIITPKPHLPLVLYPTPTPTPKSKGTEAPLRPPTVIGQSRYNAPTPFHGKLCVLVQNVGTGIIKISP